MGHTKGGPLSVPAGKTTSVGLLDSPTRIYQRQLSFLQMLSVYTSGAGRKMTSNSSLYLLDGVSLFLLHEDQVITLAIDSKKFVCFGSGSHTDRKGHRNEFHFL